MFFSQYFSFPCQYHSTTAPYSFIHLPPTPYNVFLPVLQFSHVSIILPLLRTHSSTTDAVKCFSPVSITPSMLHYQLPHLTLLIRTSGESLEHGTTSTLLLYPPQCKQPATRNHHVNPTVQKLSTLLHTELLKHVTQMPDFNRYEPCPSTFFVCLDIAIKLLR